MDFSGRNTRVGVGVGVTIAVQNFEFIKPQLYIEVGALQDEDPDNIIADLEGYLLGKLNELEEKLESHVNP